MNREELLAKVAPCSLMCHTCGAYKDGVIYHSANQLLEYLDGVCEFCERHSPNEVGHFKIFQEQLSKYGRGPCSGCRNREHHTCSIQGCFILECTKEHGIDYCGECPEFPCHKVKSLFEDEVYLQWLNGSQEIKGHGIEGFWHRNCEKPHYKAYKERNI